MEWFFLVIAGAFECAWAIGLKYSVGFSRFGPSVFTVVAMGISLIFLSLALRSIPVGTAYAIWTGIGAIGVAVLGMLLFEEPVNAARIGCILLIVAGIIGLKVFSGPGGV